VGIAKRIIMLMLEEDFHYALYLGTSYQGGILGYNKGLSAV
jgi:hypothetical protein